MDKRELDEIEARWEPLRDVYNRERLFYFDQYVREDFPRLIAAVRATLNEVEDGRQE